MPALANVILTDRATTPVQHTFAPNGREADGGRYSKAGLAVIGDYLLSVKPRKTPSGRRKIDIEITVPVLVAETINGVVSYSVTRASRAKVSLDLAPDSTVQERKDLMGFLESLCKASATQINDLVVNNEMIW
jgi:hypothetical protein